MIDYFSDRQNGPVARTEEVITPEVWAAKLDEFSLDSFAAQVVVSGLHRLNFVRRGAAGGKHGKHKPE